MSENRSVINKLLSGNDAIVYNLVPFICEQANARLYTDGRSYLAARTSINTPVWVFVNAQADEQTEKELISVLSEMLRENNSLSVNAQAGFTERVLTALSNKFGLKLSKRAPLNAYFIRKVREITPVGEMIVSEVKYESKIATLIGQSSVDDCDGEMTDEEAMRFARANANTGNLFLWIHNEVVSMARIVRYKEKYARLTSIATERSARGKGYAKMLVGEISKRLLAEGLTPVLYARSENPSSNRCYQGLGFEKAGEICEFKLEK